VSSIIKSGVPGSSVDKDMHCEHTEQNGSWEISKRKAATIALNALQLTLWQHLCGEDPWTVLPWLPQLTEGLWGCPMGQALK